MSLENQEFVGQKAKILCAGNEFGGKIIDETKNTITIKTKKGKKTIIKQDSKIIINNRIILGKKIVKRPYDRLKK